MISPLTYFWLTPVKKHYTGGGWTRQGEGVVFSAGYSVVELQTPKMMAVVAMEHGGPRGIPKDQGRIYGNLYLSHFVNCVESMDSLPYKHVHWKGSYENIPIKFLCVLPYLWLLSSWKYSGSQLLTWVLQLWSIPGARLMRNLAQISSPSLGPTREPVRIFWKDMLISIVMRLNHVGVFRK